MATGHSRALCRGISLISLSPLIPSQIRGMAVNRLCMYGLLAVELHQESVPIEFNKLWKEYGNLVKL